MHRPAGVGDEDVEPTGHLGGERVGRGDLVLDGHVGDDVANGGTVGCLGGDDVHRGHELVLGAAADGDVGAVLHEADGTAEADAASAAVVMSADSR